MPLNIQPILLNITQYGFKMCWKYAKEQTSSSILGVNFDAGQGSASTEGQGQGLLSSLRGVKIFILRQSAMSYTCEIKQTYQRPHVQAHMQGHFSVRLSLP